MMRKFFILTAVTIITLCTSCGSFDESTNSNEQLVKNELSDSQILEMQNIYFRIDSLNNVYSSTMLQPYNTRGVVSDYIVGRVADAVGGMVGGRIGQWVGAAIGSTTGNPVIAVGGYIVGQAVGRTAGAAVASMGAVWGSQNYGTRAVDGYSPFSEFDYEVYIENPDSLSDGELHNLILVELLKNYKKYTYQGGSLNYNLLLEDAYKIENRYLQNPNYGLYKEIGFSKVLEQTKRIIEASAILKGDENIDDFYNEVYDNLIPEAEINRTEYDNICAIHKIIMQTYQGADEKISRSLLKEIDSIIESSNLDEWHKAELKSLNSISRNSIEIWNYFEEKGNH